MSGASPAGTRDRSALAPIVDYLVETVPALQAVYLFGSEASGRATWTSDLDLGVLAAAPLSSEFAWKVRGEVVHLAGREVDLVDLRAVDPILAFQVLSHGERLRVLDPHAQALWEMTSLSRYQDWRVCRGEAERSLIRQIVEGASARTPAEG